MFWRRLGYTPYVLLIGMTTEPGTPTHVGQYTLLIEGGATGHKRVATNELGFTPI